MKQLWAKILGQGDKDMLDLIQGLIDVVRTEQETRASMQHEINVLRRQIADLRLEVFETKPGTVVRMPRLEAALARKQAVPRAEEMAQSAKEN